MQPQPKAYALIGAAGYIAPRHLQAIKACGGKLVAALDRHDSVGVLDSYFPEADFFTEFERFDRHLEKLKRQGVRIDYLVVCSPNYLHDSHIRFGLRLGADVICEKPLVLNPWNHEAIMKMEEETGHKVYTILQLRLHPAIRQLKERIAGEGNDRKHEVDLRYITPRGNWYQVSWKGDVNKSGGIASNLGVHFFDLLLWIFGKRVSSRLTEGREDTAMGVLELEKARVSWLLSTNASLLPADAESKTFRRLVIDGEPLDFNEGFTDLHTRCYEEILSGRGVGTGETLELTKLLAELRVWNFGGR